jgi:hypothetical protein
VEEVWFVGVVNLYRKKLDNVSGRRDFGEFSGGVAEISSAG